MPAPTLIVEDGTGVANANSYVSLDYANAYHDAVLYKTAWTENASPEEKTRALIGAARMIDASFKFKGFKTNDVQTMEWPRIYAENTESTGVRYWFGSGFSGGAYWNSNTIPERLKKAQAELAGELLKKDRTAEWDALGVSSVSLGQGAVSVDFTGDAETIGAQPFTPTVLDYLSTLGYSRAGSAQAEVRRG